MRARRLGTSRCAQKPGGYCAVQPATALVPVWHPFFQEMVKPRAVIVFPGMAKLVEDDVVDFGYRRSAEFRVQRNAPVGETASPTASHQAQRQTGRLTKKCDPWLTA